MKNEAIYRALGVDVDAAQAPPAPPPEEPVATDFDGGVRGSTAPGRPVSHEQFIAALVQASSSGASPDAFLPAGSDRIKRTGES